MSYVILLLGSILINLRFYTLNIGSIEVNFYNVDDNSIYFIGSGWQYLKHFIRMIIQTSLEDKHFLNYPNDNSNIF